MIRLRRRRLRDERGQAFTETLLVSGILVAFICAIYQLFLANEAIYRSLTAVHQNMLRYGTNANCAHAVRACTYDTDLNAKVIWNTQDVPEIAIPVIGFFRRAGLANVRIVSHVRGPEPTKGCPVPCKKTKMGAGTYMDPDDVLIWVGK